MSESKVKTIDSSNGGDKAKIAIAVLFVIAGIVAYYYFTNLNTYARIGMFVAGLAVAAVIVLLSQTGRRLVSFATASYNELKRVVWPTRKETIQMTGVVFVFAIVMATFLWLVDRLISWIIYSGILGWS